MKVTALLGIQLLCSLLGYAQKAEIKSGQQRAFPTIRFDTSLTSIPARGNGALTGLLRYHYIKPVKTSTDMQLDSVYKEVYHMEEVPVFYEQAKFLESR